MLTTKRRPLAQLVFCRGCCCGRTDRGRPELPVEKLKAIWKDEKLNAAVQLSISGCIGPCDLANVALVISSRGNEWLGQLAGEANYDAIIDWARACRASGCVEPLPEAFAANGFDPFAAQT